MYTLLLTFKSGSKLSVLVKGWNLEEAKKRVKQLYLDLIYIQEASLSDVLAESETGVAEILP